MESLFLLIVMILGCAFLFYWIGKEEGRDEGVTYITSCIFAKPADWIKILEKYIETGEIDQEEANNLFR